MKKENNIQVEIENNIGLITICRPKQLNALNQNVLQGLSFALDEFQRNKKVRLY